MPTLAELMQPGILSSMAPSFVRDLQAPQQGVLAGLQSQPSPYDTRLSPADEARFRMEFPDPRSTADYDMRGAWKAGATKAPNGHLPDTYKKPNHITFSDESMYHGQGGNMGGRWQELPGNKWSFTPGPTNLRNTSIPQLQQYFQQHEPDAQLILQR